MVGLIRGTDNPVVRCAPRLAALWEKHPAALTTDELVARCLRFQVENDKLRNACDLLILSGELLADECADEKRCEGWDETRDEVNRLLLPNAQDQTRAAKKDRLYDH